MEARELRIGNYTYNSISKKYGAINIYDLTDISNGESSFEPIPLTPEILEGCGFVKLEYAGNWANPEVTIYSLYNNFRIGVKGDYIAFCNQTDDDYYTSYYPQFKYLHQLQNFYFAYKGEELPVNLSLPKTIA